MKRPSFHQSINHERVGSGSYGRFIDSYQANFIGARRTPGKEAMRAPYKKPFRLEGDPSILCPLHGARFRGDVLRAAAIDLAVALCLCRRLRDAIKYRCDFGFS
jgi:hypothetical protein